MASAPRHILLIEDNADVCADLRRLLLSGGTHRYRFSEARLGAEGLRTIVDARDPVDCVLLGHDLPDMNAHEVLAALRDESGLPPCAVVVVTDAAIDEGRHLLRAGAQDHIARRRTTADSLTRTVENAIERSALLTEHRVAQAALRTSEARYRALFNSIDAGYAVMELGFDDTGHAVDARYLQVNPAFERQTGLRHAAGRMLHDLVPDIEDLWLQAYASVATTGEPLRMERHSEALQRWFDVYAFRLGAPQARQVAVLFHDTTERKQSELALVAAKAEAEEANRAKSDFLLSMSHELRSPLSAMLGFAQLLEAGKPTPTAAQQDSVEQILSAGWYLLGLINEIIDLTSIESGKQVFATQPMSLQDVLDDCEAMIEPQAQAAGIRTVFPSLQPVCFVLGDPSRTKQVLVNLLSNAIKYNRSAGQVEVRCTPAPGRRVRVWVEDTGPGLTAAQLAQLFEPFNRLGKESGTEPGTGIGLVICKRLVELMGGCIGADSTPGAGSRFWFELDTAPPPVQGSALPKHTVLYVEEDAGLRPHIEPLLAALPTASLLRAGDIHAGIRMARSARPDVILIGIRQADPSGLQAMHLLARDPSTTHIPVIALGAEPAQGDADAALAAGCLGFFAQPIECEAFAEALDLAFRRTRPVGPRATVLENT